MSLFQTSVVKKYLNELSPELIDKKYTEFQAYFGNPEIQQNIRESKEEEYQSGFVSALFVNILGYTLKPEPNYNFVLEKKNIDDSKKADGAILKDKEVIAVIELKSTQTTDLDTVETQAFGYKNHNPKCQYIITSNFEKIRLYIQDAVDHLEFDLFSLSREDFALLWLCFLKDNILQDIPLKIKEASILQEENVTKKLYNDYSNFRKDIFNNIVKNNPEYDKLVLFKKTQKLLDRFLFIFFAEDRLLVPPNSINQIIEKWKDDVDFGDVKPLYSIFKQYFHVLNVGRPKSGKRQEIFPYNGGLFLNDEILDKIKIDDDILYKHTLKLSTYDFETEVDVNILGHIFEHSLGEIENVQAEIKGEEVDKQKTRRKKDGIFYTPKYITKYIVENTVGKLCEEKRNEFGIIDEEYAKGRKNRKKDIVRALDDKLNFYRDWLLNITILDPACGSGAFLNQAMEFLIQEHRKIDELRFQLLGGSIVFPDFEDKILEKNIYGVDLNEESVEIAKLSLWLRTARKGRKLTTLSNHIKCGNSLIHNPEVAGVKSFNWQMEFPEVFGNGGFDVVIGNPPYVNAIDLKKNLSKPEYDFLKNEYITAKGTVDLYIYFFEKGLNIIKNTGILSFITPNRFLSASYGKALRELLIEKYQIISLIDYSDKIVFPDASTYPVISILKNKTESDYQILTGKFNDTTKLLEGNIFKSDKLGILDDSILGFLLNDKLEITEKIFKQCISLKECGLINGTSTAKEADDYSKLINEEQGYKLINTGTIDPYITTFGFENLTDKGKHFLTPYLPKDSSIISANRHKLYSSPKIIISKIGLTCEAFYDKSGNYASINTNCIHNFNDNFLPEYILCWLNSNLYNYLFECFFDGLRMSGGYLLYSSPNLKNTYIKLISKDDQYYFIEKSNDLAELKTEFLKLKFKMIKFIQNKFEIDKLSNKLHNWFKIEYKEFIKELNKSIKSSGKITITTKEEIEWMDIFDEYRNQIKKLISSIDKIENEINYTFYNLFNLTDEEKKIVESHF